MLINKVRYCSDDVAIKRLRYIMSDIDSSIVDHYLIRDGQYTLFFNIRLGVTLLLFKKRDDKDWIAIFKTNYTKRVFLYCLLAARVICKNVRIIVNEVDDSSIMDEAKLLDEAGYKFRMISSERFDAFSKCGDDNIIDLCRSNINGVPIPKDFGCFIIEEDNRVPISINSKK